MVIAGIELHELNHSYTKTFLKLNLKCLPTHQNKVRVTAKKRLVGRRTGHMIKQIFSNAFSSYALQNICQMTHSRITPLLLCPYNQKSDCFRSRLLSYSSSIFEGAILSFGPSSRQHVPASSVLSASCSSITTEFLGSVAVSMGNINL